MAAAAQARRAARAAAAVASALLVVGVLLVTSSASAGPDGACDTAPQEVDRFQLLRQLTLDLWGRVPTVEEMNVIRAADGVTDAHVQSMLDAPAFDAFLNRYHEDLLWPAVNRIDLVSPALALLLPAGYYQQLDDSGGDPTRLFLLYVGLYTRGGLVPCKDEPAEFDADGELVLEPWPDGTLRDGWVLVEPYWAPGTQVKVCALEARIAPLASTGSACNTAEGMATGQCGCGPGLEHCLSVDGSLELQSALREQMLRALRRPVREGASYFDALLGRTEDVNGPIAHYYRHLTQMAVDPIVLVPPVLPSELPDDLSWPDGDTWRTVPRRAEHSGILTSLAYLLRFQTARSRANRFYNAFFCAPFQAPEGNLPSPSDPCSDEPDLRKRCGCNYCHAALEPAAAHWARFADAGALYLDPLTFPAYLPRCATCADNPSAPCDFICERFYLTRAGHPKEAEYVGMLKNLMWRDDDGLVAVSGGPRRMVEQALDQHVLGGCVVDRLFQRFLNRPMSDAEVAELRPALMAGFADSGWSFSALVKAIVTRPEYRRRLP